VSLYPLTFSPVFKRYTWGGRKLGSVVGRDIPDGIVAESWEVSAHRNGPTPVLEGPLAGLQLSELQERFGEELVGSRNRAALERGTFPLLIKFLDAHEWLSVQVHPGDEYAREHENDLGKTEMWVVLQADPGSQMIFGLSEATDRAHLQLAISEKRLEPQLHRLEARAGDVFLVPSGTVHALGPGLLLAEIQQSSDATYRLYDWGRDPDADPPRPLHIERSLDVLDYDAVRPSPVQPGVRTEGGYQVEELATCPYFETERLSLPAGATYEGSCNGQTFELWCVLTGTATLHWNDTETPHPAIQWILLPASLGDFRLTVPEDTTLLRVFTPAPQ
jgi:mannose-6-phosphate isomerase